MDVVDEPAGEDQEMDNNDDTKMEMKVLAAQIGSDLLCQLVTANAGVKKKMKGPEMKEKVLVLILDCSGSMGNWVQLTVDSWQIALRQLNYPEDTQTILIEFESDTTTTRHTLASLDKLNMECRGGTSMSGVVDDLSKLLVGGENREFYIWVVSDGQIDDQQQFKKRIASRLSSHFKSPNINVCGVRLKDGNYSDPDTQAMCAVGLLSDKEFKLEDFQLPGYDDPGYGDFDRKGLAELFTTMRVAEEAFPLSTSSSCLVQRPGEEVKTMLSLWNKDFFLAIGAGPDLQINVEEDTLEIEMIPHDETLKVLEQFASKVYFRLAQEKVAGLYDNTTFIDALEGLFVHVDTVSQEYTETMETDTRTTTSRAEEILKKFGKQQKSIRQKIRELRNLADIEQMSGNMQSNLLRQLATGKKGDMGLAKRYMRAGRDAKDPATMMSEVVTTCSTALEGLKNEKEQEDAKQCFVSLETSLEGAVAASENGSILEAADVSVDYILTLFGLVGVAVQHKVGNYTDPMLLGLNQGNRDTITRLYPGVVLNQSLIWDAKINDSTITAPGYDKTATITAVVPIKAWNHPAVWRLYTQDTVVANLQTSAHIRQALTPLPRDRQALSSSLLLKMLAEWGLEAPSEVQGKTMSALFRTIQWKNTPEDWKERTEALLGPKPESQFTTEQGLASQLAPFALVFCEARLLSFLGSPDAGPLWRALVSNTIYWTVRRALGPDLNRREVVKKLVGLSEEHYTHPLPDEEEEPEVVVLHESWDQNKATAYMAKHKYLLDNRFYCKMVALAQRFKKANGKISEALFSGQMPGEQELGALTVGMDFKIFCFAQVVKSILIKNEVDRFDKEANCDPNPLDTLEEVNAFLKNVIRDLYKEVYDRNLQTKKERVREKKLTTFLEEFHSQSYNTFATELNENIPNATHKGFPILLDSINHLKNNGQMVDLSLKLQLLLLGSFSSQTWNNGSVLRDGGQELVNLLTTMLDTDRMTELKEYVEINSLHKYREAPNRQGHSNEAPSFWASTNHPDPWSFLKRDARGYKAWLERLRGMERGSPGQQFLFREWKHLLHNEPSKHDFFGGKLERKTGKMRKKEKRLEKKSQKKSLGKKSG